MTPISIGDFIALHALLVMTCRGSTEVMQGCRDSIQLSLHAGVALNLCKHAGTHARAVLNSCMHNYSMTYQLVSHAAVVLNS